MAHHIFRGIAQLVEQRSPKPRAEGSSPSAPAKTKRHLWVSFYFVVKAEGLEPRNSKVPALLTVNSPVDCLRIELIIKPLPKKAPIYRCFFPLFTPFFHFHTVFCSLCATQSTQSVWYIIKKSINHNSNPFVTPISISVFRFA